MYLLKLLHRIGGTSVYVATNVLGKILFRSNVAGKCTWQAILLHIMGMSIRFQTIDSTLPRVGGHDHLAGT